jgi:hypothetical protein
VAWTTEKPTQTGWYWYKEEDRLVCRHSNGDNEGIEDSQAQWAGPPEAPE